MQILGRLARENDTTHYHEGVADSDYNIGLEVAAKRCDDHAAALLEQVGGFDDVITKRLIEDSANTATLLAGSIRALKDNSHGQGG